jgi:hypothetical protein
MDSICIVNINVQKKFMKCWYKKNKITLQDISLTKQEGPKGSQEEDLTGKLIVVPINTLDEQYKVESKEEPTK